MQQNNRLKRPDTGNVNKKPPMSNTRGTFNNEDEDYLNNSNNSNNL